ncbi:aldehyde ferredoxin oxidoreductase [archaeon]|nr:MAG: aldehyde ferredoxin oxidoreductase [archaeon]
MQLFNGSVHTCYSYRRHQYEQSEEYLAKLQEEEQVKGVFGRYVDADLSTGKIRDYEIPLTWYQKYLGGRGIGLRILLEEMNGDEDPLEEDNIIVFSVGPLQGTGVAGAGRYAVISKSPKTGSLNDTYAGGFFGHELGTSGYDGIIIRGKAPKPVYLSLVDGKPELHYAHSLWGQQVVDTENALKEKHPGVRVASIGPAGENLVKFACIISDRNRAAARPGFGSVMGSKNLKAIAVRGGIQKSLHDAQMLAEVRKRLVQELTTNADIVAFGKGGTASCVHVFNDEGLLPTKNFQEGVFDGIAAIDAGTSADFKKLLVGNDNCTGCPVRCKLKVDGEFKGQAIQAAYGAPEYETLAALGSNCMNDDIAGICYANQLCNAYGLDTMSTGVTISFLMEASEKNLIDEKINWGDAKAIVQLIEQIARREGIGDLLARGVDYVAKELGADFAMHIKGQELAMHDPRGKRALGISYATTPRGANHMEALQDDGAENLGKYGTPEIGVYGPIDRLAWKDKSRYCKKFTDLGSFSNSAIVCTYIGWDGVLLMDYNPYPRIREALYATTGLEIGVCEMLSIGERTFNLLKLAAAQQGYTRDDDKLPERFQEPLPRGMSRGEVVCEELLQEAIDDYYRLRGWDRLGPTDQKLSELDMTEFIGFIDRKA